MVIIVELNIFNFFYFVLKFYVKKNFNIFINYNIGYNIIGN